MGSTDPVVANIVIALPLFEIARVLVRFNHGASFIVNANHGIVGTTEKLRVVDCIADYIWLGIPQATVGQRVAD